VKCLISFVAVVPLLVSGFAMHGQEARGGAALPDAAEWEAPVPAAARAKAVELVEAPALSHGLDDFGCQPDELAFARKPTTLRITHLGPGPSLARFFGLRRYSQSRRLTIRTTGVGGRARLAGCMVTRLHFKPAPKLAGF
jgi:hypothetical protein